MQPCINHDVIDNLDNLELGAKKVPVYIVLYYCYALPFYHLLRIKLLGKLVKYLGGSIFERAYVNNINI